MRWKIRQFVFCEKNQTLSDDGSTVILEPLSVEVLAYFCRHPNVMISRDVLITEVWNSRIVTDNAVTRVITRLRKALADTPDSPRFILTFPKKGYKFVADVVLLDESSENQTLLSKPVPKPAPNPVPAEKTLSKLLSTAALTLSAFICCLFIWLWFSSPTSQLSTNSTYRVDALTLGVDREFHPAVSPDGRYLTFSTFAADGMRLHLKDLETEETVEIGDQHGWSGPAAWSDDGKQIVYLNTTNDTCQYYLVNIAKLVITERALIHNCPKGSYGKIIFSHEKHKFIYAETPGPTQPFSIFELNTRTGSIHRLPQPELILGGNSQFDLHPNENKLLISSPNSQQWLGIYSLDLTTQKLNHLFELREYTCCAIWDHSGERVVIQGEHPTQELVSFNLDGMDKTTLFQVPHSVSSPTRIRDGKSYAYVGGVLNRDIYFYSFADQTSTVLIDSAPDDRLPTITQNAKNLAFISDRSGNEEVWIRQEGQAFERKLTNYKDSRHYFDIQWSPDAKLIAGMTINEIHLTDAINGTWRKLKLSQEELSGISWKDDETISFSVKKDGQWQVRHYNTVTDQLTVPLVQWQFVRHNTNKNDSVWIDQNSDIFYGEDHKAAALKLTRVFQNRNLNLLKVGDSIFYTSVDSEGSHLIQFNLITNNKNRLLKIDTANGFWVSDSGFYYSQLKSNLANIYKASKKE